MAANGVRFAALLMALCLALPAGAASEDEERTECRKGETKTELGCVRDPRLISKINPVYPPEARRQRAEGSVTLEARITEEGSVDEIKVRNAQATDPAFIPKFEDAAKAALGKWRYRPGTVNGKPVAVHFTVTIDFVL